MRPNPDPIGDYALLSDSHGSALLSRGGSIDWACLPRFDRPSVFARILGPNAGHWRISPTGTTAVERAYPDGMMVLQTVFRTPSGTAALIDAMPFGRSERGHRIGRDSPHAIVRVVKGLGARPSWAWSSGLVPNTASPRPCCCPIRGGRACPDEARELFDFSVTAAGGQVDGERDLQVLYGVGGERHLPEQVLEHLPGHRESWPVRVGNGAWGQTRLDIYCELLPAADLLADRIGAFDEVTTEFLSDLADAAARRWEQPGGGQPASRASPSGSSSRISP